jgi:hypothetical protein
MVGVNQTIHDQAVIFGAGQNLVGIVTQPIDYQPGERPVFVILNYCGLICQGSVIATSGQTD